ncbi:hypothetical protein DL764_010997 [Monosporascus ibericus]|uniref:Ferric oxidoreductase domain-containing protein n=1 Tax=Monosporascus ibericus TaxID=155417 RepID=A0A4Q4STY7_9PEZI|nr:hypothetical protein DL764_010997 [Monosporascus ibericus]
MTLKPMLGSLAVALMATAATAQSSGRPGYGLIGYGITMYQPGCAFACRASLPRSSIPCDVHLNGHHSSSVSAECLADSTAFLESAAWCISVKCGPDGENVPVSAIEKFWETDLVGRELNQPQPKWTYQESLARVAEDPPTQSLEEEGVFNRTVVVDEDQYIADWNGNTAFENVEVNHETYGIVLLVSGAVIPIFFSLLRFVPFPARFTSKVYAYLIDPPAFGQRHAVPILGLGLVPTRGQALFILYIIAINVILNAVGIESRQPHSWYPLGQLEEVINYVANRAGVLSFANLPLLILYAGRNNVLLWLTNWSHSTFLLLHRWVALMCILQACLHSALWLHLHVIFYNDHDEVSAIPYWYWGIIGTVALALMIPLSVLPIRQRIYEFFHAAHIALAIITIVGCWYHIIYRYERQWGYENWVLAAIAVWVFEWMIRAVRIARNGVKRGYVTKVDEEYLCIDIPDVECRGHVYISFPTLSWRLWESHPFSIAGPTTSSEMLLATTEPTPSIEKAVDANTKNIAAPSSSNAKIAISSGSGISLFIRIRDGTTYLASQVNSTTGIPLLIESSYGSESKLYPDGDHATPSAKYPNLVVIAGGVGITAVLPTLSTTQSLYRPLGSCKLYWGVREQAQGLVKSVQNMVNASVDSYAAPEPLVVGITDLRWGDVDVQVSVGERFNLRAVIEADVSASKGDMI